jgi:hypothetical protein
MRPLFIVPHTHWDREWYQPHELFRWRLVRMIDEVIDHLEAHPDYPCFNLDGQAIVVEDYLALRPERRERLAALVRAGRVVIGPWWVQPDEFLPTGESHIRSLVRGTRYARRFGASSRVGHCADQFGHIAQMPQIMAQLGLVAACLWRGVPDAVPGWSFWWEAPDGTRIPVLSLRHSYSNGWRLPRDPEALLARVREAEEGRAPGEPLLLMNGTDHSRMERHLPELLPVLRAAGYDARIVTLDAYAEEMLAWGIDEVVHRGELRSPDRSNVLPGVLSSRMNLKQRDFEVQSRLERIAEPLELLAWLRGGPDGAPALRHAWSLALENSPHDSICGCSVDQTHREMLPRYDRAEQLAEAVTREALAHLASCADVPEPGGILLFRPAPFAPVPLEVEVPSSWGGTCLRLSNGRTLPAAFGPPSPDRVLVDREVSVRAALAHLDFLREGRYDDRWLEEVRVELTEGSLLVTTVVGRGVSPVDDEGARAEARRLVREGAPSRARVRVIERGMRTVRAVLPPSPAIGVELLCPDTAPHQPPPLVADGREIRSERFRVRLEGRGLAIDDTLAGVELREAALFLDEGDRGDEYNADILDDAIFEPSSLEFLGSSADAVTAELRYRVRLAIPRRLAAGRDRRTQEDLVPLEAEVRARLWHAVPWVELTVAVDNPAEDHRLRLAFPLPFETEAVWTENQFHVAERSVRPQPWNGRSDELPTAAFPQKCFAAVERDGRGVAVFNRGLPEGEVVHLPDGRQAYTVTLLRCVGWLSRPDLRTRRGAAGPTIATFDSQMLGGHVFRLAVAPYSGTWRSAGVLPLAHAFAHLPAAVWASARQGAARGPLTLAEFDAPDVVPSALARSETDGRPYLRVWSAGEAPREAHIRLPWAASAERTNLLGEDARPLAVDRGAVRLPLRPWEIATIAADPVGG